MTTTCEYKWVQSFDTKVPSGYALVCWDQLHDADAWEPPTRTGGSGGGGSSGSGIAFIPSDSGSGSVSIANSNASANTNIQGLNIGWNSGAYSIETLAADWKGTIKFDVPDVLNSRPGGVAIGMALVANLPTLGRNGYQHLAYGLVFTGDDVKVIQDGAVILTVPYADIRALRASGVTTDIVSALMFGNYVKWMVNGVPLFAGAFTIGSPYALDATLFTALDAVDNPAFVANTWGTITDDFSFDILLPAVEMTGEAQADDVLDIALFAVEIKLSEYEEYSDMDIRLPAISFVADEIGDSVAVVLAGLDYEADESDPLPKIKIELPMLTYWASMDNRSDDPDYAILFVTLPALTMAGECVVYETIQESLSPIVYRADEGEYADIQIELAAVEYSGRDGTYTRLVDVTEYLGVNAQIGAASHISIVIIERVGGTSTVVVSTVMSEDASEQITAEDQFSVVQTFLANCLEQIGAGDRIRVLLLRADGSEVASETWVVNTESSASTRYDSYGFNSFAAIGGQHYGCRADGIYLLEGADDAGRPIEAGVNFGQHDFGTQALKSMDAVYVGVSSTGALFLKVGDGENEYTYKARRNDERMKTQRFDTGRGLRSNFFTFELTNEDDAFELDSVTFNVVASKRRI